MPDACQTGASSCDGCLTRIIFLSRDMDAEIHAAKGRPIHNFFALFFACRRFQRSIRGVIHRLKPFVCSLLTRNLYGNMGKPTVRLGAMPVFNLGRDGDDHAGFQADSRLARLLIPTAARCTDEQLAAAGLCVVDVSMIAATRLKGDIRQRNRACFRVGQGIQIGISDKILGICRVSLPLAKAILPVKFFFVMDSHRDFLSI